MHNDGRGLLTNTRIENRNTRKLMKDLILGILLVTSLAFGSLFMHERLRTRAALADNTGLRQQVAELEAKGSQQEEKASRLRDRLAESFSDASAKADEVARLQ